jgi:hypothetical protein
VQKQFGTEPARDRHPGERAKQAPRHPTVAARALRVLASARSTAWSVFAYRRPERRHHGGARAFSRAEACRETNPCGG